MLIAFAWFTPRIAHAGTIQCGKPIKDGTYACYIDPTLDPLAVCADGTVPAFWYRPGYGSGITTWLIWFGGGGACDSGPACADYVAHNSSPTLESSNGFLPSTGKGVTADSASENPALYNANTIYLHYCTADSWVGNQQGTGPYSQQNSATWNFAGRHDAVAFIETINELLPAIANASTIILGGDSSGGVGVTLNANSVLPLLPTTALTLLVNDAGFMFDIGQYYPAAGPLNSFMYPDHPNFFETSIPQRLAYWNATGDAICTAAATTAAQQDNCYNTAYVLQNGYIQIPTFVAISQLDTSQLTDQLCPSEWGYCPFTRNPSGHEGIYETAFAAQAAAIVVGAGTQAAYTAYAPNYFMHVVMNDQNAFITPLPFPQGQIAPRDMFDAWLANQTTPPAPSATTDLATGPGVGTYPTDK